MAKEEKKSIFSLFPNYVSPLGDWEQQEKKEEKILLKSNNEINNTNSLEDKIVNSYWTDSNLDSFPIKETFFGKTVYFYIKTEGISNESILNIKIFEHNTLLPNKKMFETTAKIKNNIAVTKPIVLEKKEEWLNLLKDTGEENELELYCEISHWNQSVDRGKYLKLKNKEEIIVFFIGGAADKDKYLFQGPNNNILEPKKILDKSINDKVNYTSYYIDYSEAFDNNPLYNEKVLDRIPSKQIPIYILGHSLGGWNGAHLSQILTDKGYKVKMLITLDPVGEGYLVYLASTLYRKIPKPKADFWINIHASPTKPDSSDDVAEFGERWIINNGPDINISMDINHWNAEDMFKNIIKQKKSAHDFISESIIDIIGKW